MEPERPRRTARSAYRLYIMAGFDPVSAGNLTGLGVGLPPVAKGWTWRQVDALLFLRWLRDSGRLSP